MMLVSNRYKDVAFNVIDSGEFLKKRVLRVLPLNTIFIILSVLSTFLFVTYGYTNAYAVYHFPALKIDFLYFIESMFFVHFDRPSINEIAWTLQYEAIFYLLFSVSIFLGVGRERFFMLLSALIFILAYKNVQLNTYLSVILSPFHIELFFGILTFKVMRSKSSNRNMMFLMFLAILVYVVVNVTGVKFDNLLDRVLNYGLISLLIFCVTIKFEGKFVVPKAIGYIGDASYSVYLTHWLVVIMFASFYSYVPFSSNFIIFVSLNFVTAVVIFLLVYRFVEKPMTNTFNNK